MSYIAPGNTACIKKQLTQHPHMLLLFQRALGMLLLRPNEVLPPRLADYPRTSDGRVKVAGRVGVIHQLHRGSSKEGVLLLANPKRHDFVRIRAEDETWFVELQLLFCLVGRCASEYTFVRWLTAVPRPAHARSLELQALKWKSCRVGGVRGIVPKTDTVSLDSIIGPCYIQPDPVNQNIHWYNHWVPLPTVGLVMNDSF